MTVQANLDYYAGYEVEGRLKRFLRRKKIREELRKAAATTEKSLIIDFETLLEFDMILARYLIDRPRDFLSSADRILEKATGIQEVHLRVRNLDKPSRARAKEVGKFIMVWGYVVAVADGGSRIKIQDLPKVWIQELDAPLNVKPWPGWGASWPLWCAVPSYLTGVAGLGDLAIATGGLTVEHDEETDPTITTGLRYVLEVNHIEVPLLREYVPRRTAERQAISDLFERLFGCVDKLTIIDKHNVYRGTFPDTPGFRVKLKILGFEIAGGVATKQYTDHKEVS